MLSETEVRKATTRDKAYKLADSGGLYLHVSPVGGKSWRFDFRAGGRRQTLTLGRYPEFTLKEARDCHFKARQRLAHGGNPAVEKRREKQVAKRDSAHTFQQLAEAWFRVAAVGKSESWRAVNRAWLKNDVYPHIGERSIKEVDPADILDVIQRVEARGAKLSAERVRSVRSQVFRHGIRILRADRDPAHAVRGAVKVPKAAHHPTLAIKELPAFLRAVDGYSGAVQTKLGMRLLLLTFTRKGELTAAKWDEVDLDSGLWQIPAENMKAGEAHTVPFSRQAVALFRELQKHARGSVYVFPNRSDIKRPAGPSRFNDMIVALGYTGRFSPHGARSLASTALNEIGYRSDVIERQLAHAERNKVRDAYNRAEYLEERRSLDASHSAGERLPLEVKWSRPETVVDQKPDDGVK